MRYIKSDSTSGHLARRRTPIISVIGVVRLSIYKQLTAPIARAITSMVRSCDASLMLSHVPNILKLKIPLCCAVISNIRANPLSNRNESGSAIRCMYSRSFNPPKQTTNTGESKHRNRPVSGLCDKRLIKINVNTVQNLNIGFIERRSEI